MPYQTKVSIGSKGHDTGRWMSPMKMFEYMAAGVPIISSDLPVLREILRNEENALLVSPSKHKEWCMALDRLSNDPVLAESIGKCAYSDYKKNIHGKGELRQYYLFSIEEELLYSRTFTCPNRPIRGQLHLLMQLHPFDLLINLTQKCRSLDPQHR